MKVSYLGPEASFTQLAARKIFGETDFISKTTILDCFLSVESEEADHAVVPLENSIEGTVSMTLDLLHSFGNMYILSELIMPISHHLMVYPGNAEFDRIFSHPQALAQTFHFRFENYKEIPTQDFSSTAASAKKVSENPDKRWAAIANSYAAELYGLKILHENIQDVAYNYTRFIVISGKELLPALPYAPVRKKASIIVVLPEDHAGGLHQVLSVFAWRKLNLSKIESRTLKTGLGNYFFFINVDIDVDGEWQDILFRNSLEELEAIGASVKFLGHYGEFLIGS
ncbi:MAG: prephenate dehydratase [Bergeyella sp.]|nr:prephenate dehydratase [Bergeyella sp.]